MIHRKKMENLFVALVLFSAILHASWNALLHLSADRLWQWGMMAVPYAVISGIAVTVLPLPAQASWPYIAASTLLQFAYAFALIKAYRSGDFGQIYPIARGLSPLLIAGGAFLFAGESLHPLALGGIGLVSVGIISLSFKNGLRFSAQSVPAALLTGVFIAGYTVVDGMGVRLAGNAFSYIAWVYLLWSIPLLLTVYRLRGGWNGLFGQRVMAAKGMAAGLVSLTAYGIVINALQYLPMGMVSALRELSSIFAVAMGWLFMQEKLTMRRLLACALVSVGAVLIRI